MFISKWLQVLFFGNGNLDMGQRILALCKGDEILLELCFWIRSGKELVFIEIRKCFGNMSKYLLLMKN